MSPAANGGLVALMLGLTASYVALGARRVFEVGAVRAWGGAALVAAVGLPASIMAYRAILFVLTVQTLRLPPPG